MEIFKATEEDVGDFLKLAEMFYNDGYAGYEWGYNKEHAKITFLLFLKNHICYMAHNNGEVIGLLAGIVTQHHFNYEFQYFQEAMWYVLPEYRKLGIADRLLEVVERECVSRGCKKMVVGHTENVMPRELAYYYKSKGFELFETHYIKDTKWHKED
jgi:GNAT superfamily N-acetyltransferase